MHVSTTEFTIILSYLLQILNVIDTIEVSFI